LTSRENNGNENHFAGKPVYSWLFFVSEWLTSIGKGAAVKFIEKSAYLVLAPPQ